MLSLTKIFLHNWHRFHHHVIAVQDSLYLAGHNGSGKSSVLDALQLVLLGDLSRVKFNSSAQDSRSTRSLDTYVRAKMGEQRFLRPNNTAAYIALEFTDTARGDAFTVGVCIEAAADRTPERTYFIFSEALDPALFTSSQKTLSRRDLRQLARQRRGAQAYDHVGEYQADLLNRLGGLNERFFDLFLRALTFKPISNIREFVEKWLLPAQTLDVGNLQRVQERLADLRAAAKQVDARLVELDAILEQQKEVRTWRELHAQYYILVTLLDAAVQTQRITALEHQTTKLHTLIRDGESQYAQIVTTLKNANEALIEIRVRLGQSDIARRRDALQQEIERTTREADAIRTRRQQVIRDLHTEATALEAALGENVFEDFEATRLQTHLALFRALHDSVPQELGAALDETQSVLQSALTRTQQELFGLEAQLKRLRERGDILERELTQLRKGGTAYSGTLEKMRAQLADRLGSSPALLCEQLEIPDARWQDAVEALLGARRFILLVPPTQFEAALQILDEARGQKQVYGVSLLDLERVQRDARPARAQSLALEISTQQPALRAYIDSVLGEVITCETPQELRQHRRAVTPQLMVYQEWTVRAIAPHDFRPWYVGARAQRSQIEVREQEQRELRNEFLALAPRQETRARQVKQLERIPQLAGLRVRLDAPLDDTLLRTQIAEAETELHALDLSGIAALEAEATRWQALIQAEESNKERVSRQNAKWDAEQAQVTTNMATARALAVESQIQLDQVRNANTDRFAAAQVLLAARLSQPDLPEARRNAEVAARGYDTRANNTQTALTELGTAYNTRYQFIGKAYDPDETSYAADQLRLAATDLPRYLTQIEQAQQEAEEELREHVLHRLREQIQNAKTTLQQINDALARLNFRGERYQFRYQAADDVRAYYELVNDAQLLGGGRLFESEFYQKHASTFDDFYRALTRTPQTDAERAAQEALADYRHYLDYDIEITHADGTTSRLSRIMDQTSGGETQTPFYLTIAASFRQLYRLDERSGRSTIRLVAFDEAFSKMDQDRIGATLDLFQHFQLQIITATPLERCEYLVPKMCTNLVLTAVGDHVLVEPYQNYAARLHDDINV